jgi:outer membrane protein assembly factor BamA
LDNVEQSFFTLGAVRGTSLRLSLDLADDYLGSTESLYVARYQLATYLSLPWGHQTIAFQTAGGMSTGTFTRRGTFYVGGYNLENVSIIDAVVDGVFSGAFVLRGYDPSVYSGDTFVLSSAEWRVPIADVDFGLETVPVYLRRAAANFFVDYGGAFNDFDWDAIELFSRGSLIYSPQLATGLGAELWLELTLGYGLNTLLRFGYAYGTSSKAVPGGQPYFIAAGAF